MILLAAALLSACAAGPAEVAGVPDRAQPAPTCEQTAPAVSAGSADPATYRISRGDQLAISFYLVPEFDQGVTVRPDGKIAMKLVGDLPAAGLTPVELEKQLNQAYSHELLNPESTVKVQSSPSRRVYVEGMVAHPGAIQLQPGMRVVQAVAEAGGITEDAGASHAVLIRHDPCGYPHSTEFDLADALSQAGSGDDLALMPADVVVVPRSGIANVNLFVKQFVKNMIPVDPYLPLIP